MTEKTIKAYRKLKETQPDRILLIRCGNVYECYNEDAKKVGAILVLPVSDVKDETYIDIQNMVSIPEAELQNTLYQLILSGVKIGVCDNFK